MCAFNVHKDKMVHGLVYIQFIFEIVECSCYDTKYAVLMLTCMIALPSSMSICGGIKNVRSGHCET
jgi:hypothetical protein